MTEIDFYILNARQNRLDFAAKLCHKVYTMGHKVFICTEDKAQSDRLSENLWSLNSDSFLANQIIDTETDQPRSASPIKISHNICDQSAPLLDNDVLINISLEVPPNFSRFKRSVEIIDQNEEVKEKLRSNYSFYKQRGYPLRTHDLNNNNKH